MKRYALFLFFVKMLAFSLALIFILLTSVNLFYRLNPKEDGQPVGGGADLRPIVIVDAGHGGVDSGAVSVLGQEEKHLNLSVAKKLGAFLEAGGVRVIYTRQEDALLTYEGASSRKTGDLMGRVEIANHFPEAIFVSIHMNTLPIEKYRGLQVFYDTKNSFSHPLALSIQNDVKQMFQPENTREVKNSEGKIFVLDRIQNPAVLIECGFLSNYEEAALLGEENYQTELAYVLSRSILSFALAENYEEI